MTPRAGKRNALSDVSGVRVGNAHDAGARTGVTVLAFDRAMRCAADVRGGGPATRETNAVGSDATLGIAHAITLSGGSVFGLAAADEVATVLSARGAGFVPVQGTPPVPIIPAASLYDLSNRGDKAWGETPPYRALAREALGAATEDVPCGSVGAGYGATAGAWLGGLGTASLDMGEGGVVSALIAVNSIGSAVMPGGGCFWSWPFEIDGEFGGLKPDQSVAVSEPLPADIKGGIAAGSATCIGVVACSVPLDRASLMRVAIMAQDGLARAIRPSHAPFDGDTIFAICPDEAAVTAPEDAMRLGSAAADCVARAAARGVWSAAAATEHAPAFQQAFLSARGAL
jgi:L-aminopeptidase/D-esterase-like protein